MWGYDGFDCGYGAPYDSMAPVSKSALANLDRAKEKFKAYMDTLPLDECPVTDCRKTFKKFVEPHHVVLTWRKQQVKGRKSDVWLATIQVSSGAKQAWMQSQHGGMDAPTGARDQQLAQAPQSASMTMLWTHHPTSAPRSHNERGALRNGPAHVQMKNHHDAEQSPAQQEEEFSCLQSVMYSEGSKRRVPSHT